MANRYLDALGFGVVRNYARKKNVLEPETDPRDRDWREEGFSWMRPSTPAGRLFDILSRPNYAMANMALEGGRITRDEVDDTALGGLWRVLKAGGRGVAGRDKVFFEDVLDETEALDEWHPLLKTGVGLVGDIALDPLTYLSGGVTKLGRIGKTAASMTDDAGRIARGLGAVKRTASGLIDTTGMVGGSLRNANRANRAFEWARRTKNFGPEDLSRLWRGGKATQAEAGMRGLLNFAGRPMVKGTGVYRGLGRVPTWLAGTMEPGAQSQWMRSLDENAPWVRKLGNQLGSRFTAGDTLDKSIRAANLGARRTGTVTAARLEEVLEAAKPGAAKALRASDDPAAWGRQLLDLVETPGGPNRAMLDRQLNITQRGIGEAGGQFDVFGNLEGLLKKEQELLGKLADDISEAAVSGDMGSMATAMRDLLGQAEEIKTGLYTQRGLEFKLLDQPGSDWITHIQTRAGTAEVGSRPELQGLVRKLNVMDPAQRAREIRLPINEINNRCMGRVAGMDMGDVFGPEYAGLTMKNALYEDDPFALMEIVTSRVKKMVGGSEYVDNAIRDGIVTPLKEFPNGVPAGYRMPEITMEAWNKDVAMFQGFVAPHEIASELERVYRLGYDPNSVSQIMKIYNSGLNTWRGYALMAPSYHFRNLGSNIWQNFIGGVTNPEAYVNATQFQWAAHKASKDGGAALDAFRLATPFGDVSGTQLRNMLFDEDLLGGFMSEWVRELDIMHMDMKPHNVVYRNHKRLMHRNLAVGTMIENNARFALMFDRLGKGESITGAAEAVRHFLFDYTDIGLSTFENRRIRPLTSFYRWTKKNMLLSTEQLVKQPGKYAGIAKAKHAIESASAEGAPAEDYIPKWMAEGYAVRMPKPLWQDERTPSYFSLKNWLPALQVAELFEDVDEHHVPGLSWALGMAAPTISLPLEQAMNKSLFFERPLVEYPGQRTRFLGQSMSPRAAHLLRTFRPFSEANKFMQGKPAGQATQEWATGRTYPYDRMKQMRISRAQARRTKSRLKSAWKNALRRGDQREADRLLKEYLSVRK